MNLDEERKVFEALYNPCDRIAFCFGLKKYVQLSHEDNDSEIVDHANQCWELWKAAKAHEAKKLEGCVVVPVKSCKWEKDEDSSWWTECGEGFVFNDDPHPHNHNFKNCCFCGGLLETARGGND